MQENIKKTKINITGPTGTVERGHNILSLRKDGRKVESSKKRWNKGRKVGRKEEREEGKNKGII